MSGFRDEDLERVKRDINLGPVDAEIFVPKIRALLLRLEAAEQYAKNRSEHNYQKWLKSCGKLDKPEQGK